LIVTPQGGLAALLTEALQSVAIATETCQGAVACFELVRQQRFEAAFIDFSVAATAIDAIHSSPSSKTAIIIAIAANADQSTKAFERGVHFVLQQPISRSAAEGIIRAAYGLIIRERRRYFRCPIEASILAHRRTEGIWRGQVVNVSESGLCISAPVALGTGDAVELQFTLPSSTTEISTEAEVQWVDHSSGRAGLRFVRMNGNSKTELMHWLATQLDEQLKSVSSRQVQGYDPGTGSSVNKKRPYFTPRVDSYQAIGDLPSKFRAIAEDILEEHPILKVTIDQQHRSVIVSEELARLLGYSSRELRGRKMEEITSKGTTDVGHVISVVHRLRESKGLWLLEGRNGTRLLCSYRATKLNGNVLAEFTPLSAAV
jgi:PAS domain S-box-containing protein